MRFVRPSDPASLTLLVEELSSSTPTYSETGASLTRELPAGFSHHRYESVLGQGSATFERAAQGLRTWQAHKMPGMRVFPPEATVEDGATVVVTVGTPFVALAVPCRVIAVVDEPARSGFVYGTLPGHPEEGEEAFIASIADDGAVYFQITAFSRPDDSLVRLLGPLGRGVQKVASKGYLWALRRFVHQQQRV